LLQDEGPLVPSAIKIITLPLPLRTGNVNCYLIEVGGHHVLVDTGGSNARKQFMQRLQSAGCTRDSLELVVLTHGDFDHIGNAAYIRSALGARLAMHPGDLGMAERGDMFSNRKKPSLILRALLPLFSPFGEAQRFTPDLLLQDGLDLSSYGFPATVVHLPGHSLGSAGLLTADGDLLCGDLLGSTKGPALNSLMDDPRTAAESLARLRALKIVRVYPGHGPPFTMEELERP
jgi:glyoxylase-like metal-dependent hydrolase (beta-lactamase superfamily II)